MAQGFEIYNKFQALYQSSLICPNCGKQSNTYESYLCLSLPVPQRCLRPVYITVVYLDYDPKQLRIALEMNMFENVKELREKLAYELDVTPKRVMSQFSFSYHLQLQNISQIIGKICSYCFETHCLSKHATFSQQLSTCIWTK